MMQPGATSNKRMTSVDASARRRGRSAPHRSPRSAGVVVAALVLGLISTIFVSTAADAAYPTVDWPDAWKNPLNTGERFTLTTKWGAMDEKCANADTSNDAGTYLNTKEYLGHTGIDMASPAGSTVYAIASGTVRFAGRWNADNGYVVVIEHTDHDGGKFLALYGHLFSDVVPNKSIVTAGARVGRVVTAGTGPHLHLGIAQGAWNGKVPSGSSSLIRNGRNCTFQPDGTVDPLTFLNNYSPWSICKVVGFSPHTAMMGITSITLRTSIVTSGCTVTAWRLSADAGELFITRDTSPDEIINPAEIPLGVAGAKLHVDAGAADQFGAWRRQRFTAAFAIQRQSIVKSFTVQRQSGKAAIRGRLMVAMWNEPNPRFIGYSLQKIWVQRRAASGNWESIGSIVTAADGTFSATINAATGTFRASFDGSTAITAATSSAIRG